MKVEVCSGRAKEKGFALIATISIMVLLVLIVVGMLALSTSETKKAKNSEHQLQAQANARMALVIALGELQEAVGPDQRVTATGGIRSSDAVHKNIAGAWRSMKHPVTASANYAGQKDGNFLKWLVSNKSEADVEELDFPVSGSLVDPITMLGSETLGDDVDAINFVQAGAQPVEPGGGKYAWVVMDESVKARINQDGNSTTVSLAQDSANMGAANRAGFEAVESGFDHTSPDLGKVISMSVPQGELGLTTKKTGKYIHDFTVWSEGPKTNVVDGGLCQDINLITERAELPSEYDGARVYSGDGTDGVPSNPHWQQIHEYASLYKEIEMNGSIPQINATLPAGFNATTLKDAPNGIVLTPVLAKAQVVFSLVGRKPQGRLNNFGDAHPYFLHLLYAPVVTLYNPYNVSLKFDGMQVDFEDVPIGFQIVKNGQPQTTQVVPFNNSFYANSDQSKKFGMTIVGENDAPITMLPGEVKVFSLKISPDMTWLKDAEGGEGTLNDWRNDERTANAEGEEGWRGAGVAYDIDTVANRFQSPSHTPAGDTVVSIRPAGHADFPAGDSVSVTYLPTPPVVGAQPLTSMKLSTSLIIGSGDSAERVPAGSIAIEYGSESDLLAALTPPPTKSFQYPQPGEGELNLSNLFEDDDTLISEYASVKPFAIFSIYGKTTKGGAAGAGGVSRDGRYKSKAWSHTNLTSFSSNIDLVNGHGSHYSYEMNIEPLPGNEAEYVKVDANNRGNYVTAHTSLHGSKFATHNDLPLAPLQSVANLQNANLAMSGHLPKFDYPVANSRAHPLMPADTAVSGQLLDHSYLLNNSLFDKFYCSTVGDYSVPSFGAGGRDTETVLSDFLSKTPDVQLLDTRFKPWLPSVHTPAQLAKDLLSDPIGYKKIAGYQMFEGEWNVNSVSEDAWLAVLAGLNKTNIQVYDALSNSIEIADPADYPFSRFRLPNAVATSNGAPEVNRQSRWSSYTEVSLDELRLLSKEIVREVRKRGPFMSLSEFINRDLAGDSSEQLSGPLQTAIDRVGNGIAANANVAQDGHSVELGDVASYKYLNAAAAVGNSAEGAPGSLTQGHLLNALGNSMTVRSNTFRVRAYGDSVDSKGKVVARSWCEAIVQRTPDYVSGSDSNELQFTELSDASNKTLGRRLKVVAFRWLPPVTQ